MVSFNSSFGSFHFSRTFEELISHDSSELDLAESNDNMIASDLEDSQLEQLLPKDLLTWNESQAKDRDDLNFWHALQNALDKTKSEQLLLSPLPTPKNAFLYQIYRLYLTRNFSLASLIKLIKLGAFFHLTLLEPVSQKTFTYDSSTHHLSLHISTDCVYQLFCSNGSLFDADIDDDSFFTALERTSFTHPQLAQEWLAWLVPRFISYQEKTAAQLLQHVSVEKIVQRVLNHLKSYRPLRIFLGSHLLLFIIRFHPKALLNTSFDFTSLIADANAVDPSVSFLQMQVEAIRNFYEHYHQKDLLKKESPLYFAAKLFKRHINHFLKRAAQHLETEQALTLKQKQEILNFYKGFNSQSSINTIRKTLEISLVDDYIKAFKHFNKEELTLFCQSVCSLIHLALDKGFFVNASLIYQAVFPLTAHAFCQKEKSVEELILIIFKLSQQEKDLEKEAFKFKETFFNSYAHLLTASERKTIVFEKLLAGPVNAEHLGLLKQFLTDYVNEITANELKRLLIAQFQNCDETTQLPLFQIYFSLIKQKETFLHGVSFVQDILLFWKESIPKEIKQGWEELYFYLYPLRSTYPEIELFIHSFEQLPLSDTLIQYKFLKLIEVEEFLKLKAFITNKKINGQRELGFYFKTLKNLKTMKLKLRCLEHLLGLTHVNRYTKAIQASLEGLIDRQFTVITHDELTIYFSILKKLLKLPSENPSQYCAQVDVFHALEKIFPIDSTLELTFNAVLTEALSTVDLKTYKIGTSVLAFYQRHLANHSHLKKSLPNFFKKVSAPLRDQLLFIHTLLLIDHEKIPVEFPNIKLSQWESLTYTVIQHCPDQVSSFLDLLLEKELLHSVVKESKGLLTRLFTCNAFIEQTPNFIKWLFLYDLFGNTKDCPKHLAQHIYTHLHTALFQRASINFKNIHDFISLSQKILKKIEADEYEFYQILSDYYRQQHDWEALYCLMGKTPIDLTVFEDQDLQNVINLNFAKLVTAPSQKLNQHIDITKQLQSELANRPLLQTQFKADFQDIYYTLITSIITIGSKPICWQNWKALCVLASPLEMLKKTMDLVNTQQETSDTLSSILHIVELMLDFSHEELNQLLQSPLYEQLSYFCSLVKAPSLIYRILHQISIRSYRSLNREHSADDLNDKKFLLYQVYQRRLALNLDQVLARSTIERMVLVQLDEILLQEAFLSKNSIFNGLEGSLLFFHTLKILKNDLTFTYLDQDSEESLTLIFSKIDVQNPVLRQTLIKQNVLKLDQNCLSLIEQFLIRSLKDFTVHPLLDSQAWSLYSALITFPHRDFYPIALRLIDLILNQERFAKHATFSEHLQKILRRLIFQLNDFARLKDTLFYFIDHPQLKSNHFHQLKMEIFYCAYTNARILQEQACESGKSSSLLISALFFETEKHFSDLFQQTFSYIDEAFIPLDRQSHTVFYQSCRSLTFKGLMDVIHYLITETFKECHVHQITDGYRSILNFFNTIAAHLKHLPSYALQVEGYQVLLRTCLSFYQSDACPASYQLALRCLKGVLDEFFSDKERLTLNIFQETTKAILRYFIYETAPKTGRFLTTQIYQQWLEFFEQGVTKALTSRAIDKFHSIYHLFLLIKQDDTFNPSRVEVEDFNSFLKSIFTTSSPILKSLGHTWVNHLCLKAAIFACTPQNEQKAFKELIESFYPDSLNKSSKSSSTQIPLKHISKLPSVQEFKTMSLETLQKLKWVYVELQSYWSSQPIILSNQFSLLSAKPQLHFLNLLLYLQKQFFKTNPTVDVSKNAISLTSWLTTLLAKKLETTDRILALQIAMQWIDFCWKNNLNWTQKALVSFENAIKIPIPLRLPLHVKKENEDPWAYAVFLANTHTSFFSAFKAYCESGLFSKPS